MRHKLVSTMRKMKWIKWLIWSGVSVIFLVILSVVGMNMAVSYTLKAIETSSNESSLPTPKETMQSDRVIGDQSQKGNEKNESLGVINEPVKQPSSSTPNLTPTPSSSKVPPSPSSSPALSSPLPKGQSFTYQAEVTQDKSKAVEQSITLREKVAVTSVLLNKLSASEIQMFLQMASKGVSIDEKKAAKKAILGKLTEDEYNQLIQIAAKYGLSEGKNYKESLKEN
jgi:hypothetical protein